MFRLKTCDDSTVFVYCVKTCIPEFQSTTVLYFSLEIKFKLVSFVVFASRRYLGLSVIWKVLTVFIEAALLNPSKSFTRVLNTATTSLKSHWPSVLEWRTFTEKITPYIYLRIWRHMAWKEFDKARRHEPVFTNIPSNGQTSFKTLH